MQEGFSRSLDRSVEGSSRYLQEEARSYFIRAFILVACLWLVSLAAPNMPPAMLPFLMIAYALISMFGALYFITVKRLHKQYELTKDGKLAQVNRKWPIRTTAFLIVSLASAFVFFVESPKWDQVEWVLTVVAVPVYFAAYLAAHHFLKAEFDVKFLKAKAMRLSFWIVGVLLCLIYALISTFYTSDTMSITFGTLDSLPQHYSAFSSALLSEADKVSVLSQAISECAINEIQAQLIVVGFVYHFVVYAFVFFGMINQFGFCLLSTAEIKGEFQLLPDNDERREDQPLLKRYFAIVITVSVIFAGLFWFVDAKVSEARESQEYTYIDSGVDKAIKLVSNLAIDERLGEIGEEYSLDRTELLKQREESLTPMIDAYYEKCESNIDSYLDWYYNSFEGGAARMLKGFPINPWEGDIKERFLKMITDGADGNAIESSFYEYQKGIIDLKTGALEQAKQIDPDDIRNSSVSGDSSEQDEKSFTLWKPLEEDSAVDEYIFNTEQGVDRDQLKAKIEQMISEAKQYALSCISSNADQ